VTAGMAGAPPAPMGMTHTATSRTDFRWAVVSRAHQADHRRQLPGDDRYPVLRDAPVVISPPLRGAGWIAANGCCVTRTDHRGGAIPVNGQLRLPERYANDFVQLGTDHRMFTGPQADGEPERAPPEFPPPFDPATAPGNWLVVDIGNGHYVLYAHLQPHSATVRIGDRVRRGQAIAKLGNTGSSSAPHLHFQVMDAPSPSAANGLPYEFDRFASPGTVTDETALFAGEPAPIGPSLAGPHVRQLPLNLQVVDFR
jgi:murein DD-endopeptidase MepM/ murein hydrolase activator NlpD